jgi:hypothetical protein
MSQTSIDQFAAQGLGTTAMGNDLRDQYKPAHGDGNLPNDLEQAKREEKEPPTPTRVVDIVEPEPQVDELTQLRNKVRDLESQLEAAVIENQMFRRFHGSVDDDNRQLFMQSVVFLAATALEFKMDEDRINELMGTQGECLHPQEEWHDTGFGVTLCKLCRVHIDVEKYLNPPCAHEDIVEYGTMGMLICNDCGSNLPREEFRHELPALTESVGQSIPKGQPKLPVGLAPKIKDVQQPIEVPMSV